MQRFDRLLDLYERDLSAEKQQLNTLKLYLLN